MTATATPNAVPDHDYGEWRTLRAEVVSLTHHADRYIGAPAWHAVCWAAVDTIERSCGADSETGEASQ